ncbi:hypothetical protein [Arsukibacterium indicum]|uniref:Uncharacterized protein n=1 Tax=Arsukibacterium indicum TaxID=2848612 RepID=A0ABS6MMI6_9GAMM|nr:hypothetical protein [Arsukibacterium indicum]MBV2129998.1 hypothetical protein [Arsukibacterium indicum]
MKAFFALLFLTIQFYSAADEFIYDSSISPKVNRIYWQPGQTQSAIAYARFEQFYRLRDFIDLTLLTASRMPAEGIDLTQADKLYLMVARGEPLLEVYLNSTQLVFNGYIYQVDPELLKDFTRHNQRRINRGDLVPNTVFLPG